MLNIMSISHIQYLSFALLVLSLSACERPIEFDATIEKNLAVNATFTPDSSWAVFVTQPVEPLSTTPEFPVIEDAMVEIYEDGEKIAELMYAEGNSSMEAGYYRPMATQEPEEGRTYTIKVMADDFPIAYATDSIPIPNFSTPVISQFKTGHPSELIFRATINDLGGEETFYQLSMVQKAYIISGEDTLQNYVDKRYLPISIQEYNSIWTIPSELEGGFELKNGMGFLFSEPGIGAFSKNIQFRTTGVSISEDEGLVYSYSLEVRQISKTYFNYQKSIANREINQQNGLAEPVELYTNIVNGFGLFAGYSHRFSNEIYLALP